MPNINIRLDKAIFNDIYYPHLFNYAKRYEVYYGGAGSGKSHFVFQKVAIKALNNKRKILVVRKVSRTNKDSTFQLALDTLSRLKILGICNVNKSNLTITLPNGSVFLFYGLDDVEKLKSIVDITDIICEECSEMTLDDITQLDLRLRAKDKNLQMYFMFNPVSKANWTYKRWFADNMVIDDDTQILKTTYKDNKFLPDAYVQSLEKLRINNNTYYRIYTLGEFASLDKLVFTNWKQEDFNHAEIVGKLLIGLDFGFVNDKTGLIASVLDEANKRIYIFDSWGSTGKTNDEIAKIINTKGYSKSLIIADCAEQKSIEEIRRCGIQKIKASTKGKDSILHGIQKLQQYQIIVHSNCDEVITELENYSWVKDKQTGEYINKPIDDFNHYIDALRYSLQCVKDNKLKSINKSLLGI